MAAHATVDEQEAYEMRRRLCVLAAVGALSFGFCVANAAFAQKQGGILRVPHFDSPASMSLLEESTVAVNRPMMGVFNNLVMFKQDVQPLPEGVWGMPQDVLKTLTGYDPDVQKNRSEARQIMQKLGYGPDKRLALKVSTRNIPPFRDPAVILTDQLKEVFIDGELEIVETASWFPKMYRKDYKIGLNLTGGGVDDPDQQFYENYGCGSPRNYTGYCNPELEKLFDRQSAEADENKRKKLVWEIESKLAEDGARPIIFYNRFAYCWQPQVKGWTMMVNSIINNWRMEDVWLDR
jgi:peptide/nickel transport system substrate-binding protein